MKLTALFGRRRAQVRFGRFTIAALVTSLIAAGEPAFARQLGDVAPNGSSAFRESIARAAIRAAEEAQATQSPTAQEGPSWPKRHPVLMGAIIGAAGGAVIDAAGCNFNCGLYIPGAAIGTLAGILASAKKRPSYTADVTAPSSDQAEVARVVQALGVGEKVRVADTSGRKLEGKILVIDGSSFVLNQRGSAPDVTVRFQDVSVVRKQPMGVAAKAGIAIGVVAVATIVLGTLAASNSY
jgi:hypothetical protein